MLNISEIQEKQDLGNSREEDFFIQSLKSKNRMSRK